MPSAKVHNLSNTSRILDQRTTYEMFIKQNNRRNCFFTICMYREILYSCMKIVVCFLLVFWKIVKKCSFDLD